MEDYSWRFKEKNKHFFFNFCFCPFFASNLHHSITAKVVPEFKLLILYQHFALDFITVHSFSDMCNFDDKIVSTDYVISDFTKVPKTPVFGKSLNIEPAIVKKTSTARGTFLAFFHAYNAIFEKKIDLKKKST